MQVKLDAGRGGDSPGFYVSDSAFVLVVNNSSKIIFCQPVPLRNFTGLPRDRFGQPQNGE